MSPNHGVDVLVDTAEEIGKGRVDGVGEDQRPRDQAHSERDRQGGERQAQLVAEDPLETDAEHVSRPGP